MVDAVLAVAGAVGGTGSPQSSKFSLLPAKCLMSTFRTFDDEALAWCFLPCVYVCLYVCVCGVCKCVCVRMCVWYVCVNV